MFDCEKIMNSPTTIIIMSQSMKRTKPPFSSSLSHFAEGVEDPIMPVSDWSKLDKPHCCPKGV